MLFDGPATLKVVGKPAHTDIEEAEGVKVNAGLIFTVAVWKGLIGNVFGLVQPALSAVNTYTVTVLGFTTTVPLGVMVGEVTDVPLTTAYVNDVGLLVEFPTPLTLSVAGMPAQIKLGVAVKVRLFKYI